MRNPKVINLNWMFKFWFIIVIFVLICSACTENPFGENKIALSNKLKGTVTISSENNQDSIYVWLEGFNIATYTDSKGKFQITLPAISSKIGSNNLDGIFKLYYYLANYKLKSSNVTINNNSVVNFEGDFDNNGELDKPIILQNIVKLTTFLQPPNTYLDSTQAVSVKIVLQSVNENVPIYFPGELEGKIFPLILKDVHSNNVVYIETVLKASFIGTFNENYVTLTKESYIRELELYLRRAKNPL